MLEGLLASEDRAEFIRLFRQWWNTDEDKDRLLRRAAQFLGPRVYRGEYAHGAPHEFLGLVAAIQAGCWLAPAVRMDPLVQALWSAAEGRLMPAFQFALPEGQESAESLRRPFEDLWRERNVEAVCAAVAATTDSVARESMAFWLLSRTALDGWSVGHRLSYMAGAVRLCRWCGWEGAGALLFPAIHYSLVAPLDRAACDWLDNLLAHNPIRQDHVIGQAHQLADDQLDTLWRLVAVNDPGRFVNESLRMLSGGASPQAIYDGLALAAARLIQCADPADWQAPVRALLYVDALHAIFEANEPCQQVEALLLAGLIVQAAAADIERLDIQAPLWDLPPPTGRAACPPSVWADMAAALDDANTAAALRLLATARDDGAGDRACSAFFMAYAARNDGRLYATHDTQLACALMLAHSRAVTPAKSILLATLVRFLALCEKDTALWREMNGIDE